jgi:hypothetical protein
MTTDVTIHEPQEFRPSDPTGGRLVAWAEGLAAAHRIGTALCQTAFVPQTFRGKPEEAAAAILYGDEIGFTPTQALQNIYVISGKPSMYARSMVALVLHHGHEVWTVEKSSAKVTVAGRRKGSTHVIEETWTTARATKAGYTNNKKYTSDPESMLYARAAADVCRQIAPDALAGLAYVAEELELAEDQPTTTVRRAQPATKAQRAAMPEPDLEPALAEERQDTQPEPDSITDAQSKMLHASFNELGITERDQRLAYCTNLLGREVESSKELSKAEASRVIDALKSDAAEAGDEDPWATNG